MFIHHSLESNKSFGCDMEWFAEGEIHGLACPRGQRSGSVTAAQCQWGMKPDFPDELSDHCTSPQPQNGSKWVKMRHHNTS